MIDLNKYRIIDLTEEVIPGELRIDGRYLHGKPAGGRPVELQEFTAFGARMHFIQGQTHTGTHVEAPYKYSDTGTDIGSMPLECYIGQAAACNFEHKEAGSAITVDDFRSAGVRKGDVVLSPGGTPHFIRTVGNEPSLRLGVTHPESNHDVKGERSRRLVPFPDQALPPNLLHTSLDDMLARFGEPPWVEAIIHDDRNRANLICHGPGMSSNAHWHPDFDEWWTVHRGELVWDVGSNRPPIHAQEGDIVFVPEGMRHRIHTVGHETSVRLAVTTPEMPHIYTDDDKTAPAPRE